MTRASVPRPLWAFLLSLLAAGCGDPGPGPDQAPGPTPTPAPRMDPATPPDVDSARVKYPDLASFFERSIQRTCSPNDSVCHRSRQYPDMSTMANLIEAVDKRCNVIRDDPQSIDNICEPPGDVLDLSAGLLSYRGNIGKVRLVPDGTTAAKATQVVLTMKQPMPAAFPTTTAVTLLRDVPGLPQLTLTFPANSVVSTDKDKGEITFNAVPLRGVRPLLGLTFLDFLSPAIFVPGAAEQVSLADPNRDGVYGYDLGGREIKPGDPRMSYLYLRMIGPVTLPSLVANMKPPAPLTESQMPLANFDYWDIDNSVYAMYCWIKGLKLKDGGGSNASGPIDYEGCGALPDDLKPRHQGGEARTYSAIWTNILQPSCATAGCHEGRTRAGSLDLSDPQAAYAALWNQPATQAGDPATKLVQPFNPDQSYLIQKLRGKDGNNMTLTQMPLGRQLPSRDQAIAQIVTWINQGAKNN